jgi:hypothetical protein
VFLTDEDDAVPEPRGFTALSLIVYSVAAAKFAEEPLTVVIEIGEVVEPADFHDEPLSVEYW